ncbi:hypothetical protein [Massilia sp. CCM 8734]|uniref:hypothetical protein n=1 Tax=Massilia sp. CCM 8734 TaxID=2609283 RepID=UPI00141DD085|nr:hypothetical protein [Massilia sp. CCM 8734]NHZ98423.1 hypothetical protein [Massilia sp. CCM 8734]
MRLIEDDVLELIAGGNDVVTIHGHSSPGWYGGGDGGNYGGGDGGVPWWWGNNTGGSYNYPGTPIDQGGGNTNPPPPSEHDTRHTSPAPARAPANVDLEGLRDTIVIIAGQIKTMDANKEQSAAVLRMADGTLRPSEITTSDTGTFRLAVDVPEGAKIVAWIHSHPDGKNGLDQRFPSAPGQVNPGETPDTEAGRNLTSHPAVDPGAVMYILDNKSGDVYEYVGHGPDAMPVGANISRDTIPG